MAFIMFCEMSQGGTFGRDVGHFEFYNLCIIRVNPVVRENEFLSSSNYELYFTKCRMVRHLVAMWDISFWCQHLYEPEAGYALSQFNIINKGFPNIDMHI